MDLDLYRMLYHIYETKYWCKMCSSAHH